MTNRPAVSDDHGPDLPGLIDWGDELLSATARVEHERAARSRSRRRRRTIPVLAAIGVLLVPGAVVATRSIWDDPVGEVGPEAQLASTPAVRLVDGRVGDVLWRIGGWNDGGRVCLHTEAWRGSRRVLNGTNCDTPRTAAKLTTMLSDPGGLAVVAGTAAADVTAVRVRPPKGNVTRVDTVAVPAENLRRSGLTDAARVYVALFPEGFDGASAPPTVEGFGADGALLGVVGDPSSR
ncbi:MAG TPA: hypothetical protein VFG42_21080 [Baekduia sp.]|uniref:hypothetical protein n=1 Tax=Baekduia sp. TaxID=2600305 RepID=UPI002D7A0664|nr:hypothetical protein [Baekduia sp.]HET6509304.1 hypothetical protein [Baekduia sp.]